MTSILKESSKYILDENFIKLFKPIIYVQTILGSVRVNVRCNVISPPTRIQSAYSLFLISFASISFTFYWDIIGVNLTTKERLELLCAILQANIGVILNATIIIINNFMNRDSNVKLFLMLQRIDRDLKVTGKGRHNTKIYVFSILSIILLMIYHSYCLVEDSLNFNRNMVWIVPPVVTLFSVEDFETLLFLTILLILHERLAFIKKMIDFGSEIRWQQTLVNIQVHQNIWQAFNGLVEGIRLTERVFRIYMLLIVTHLFIYYLLGAKKLITTVAIKQFRWNQFIVAPDPQAIRFITRVTLICYLVHLLKRKLFQTKESCINALEKIENVTSRSYIKNMIRVIGTVQPMSVYRMFVINGLAIQLITLTLKYAIVLLQFAYS